MVKLYHGVFKEEYIKDIEVGDVIVYPSFSERLNNYLIVGELDRDKKTISGQIASRVGVNKVSVEDIVEACQLGAYEDSEF